MKGAHIVTVKEYRIRCEACAVFGYNETDQTYFDINDLAFHLLQHIQSERHQAARKAARVAASAPESEGEDD